MDCLTGTRTRRKFRSVDTGVHDRSNSQLSLERDLGFDLNPDLHPGLNPDPNAGNFPALRLLSLRISE